MIIFKKIRWSSLSSKSKTVLRNFRTFTMENNKYVKRTPDNPSLQLNRNRLSSWCSLLVVWLSDAHVVSLKHGPTKFPILYNIVNWMLSIRAIFCLITFL